MVCGCLLVVFSGLLVVCGCLMVVCGHLLFGLVVCGFLWSLLVLIIVLYDSIQATEHVSWPN